jgi:hypothetical protein
MAIMDFDKYIYQKRVIKEKIWLPQIKDDMWKLHKKGYFRILHKVDEKHYSFAIYDYFERLGLLDIVIRLGARNGKYQKILVDKLPSFSLKEANDNIALYLFATNIRDYHLSQFLLQNVLNLDEGVEIVDLYKSMILEVTEKHDKNKGLEKSMIEYI